ncbi:MAG: biotin--[acetyl-CoA-carboxylase] ligase [Hyphomicrobiales bacterium]|nr:biotin--[acetyl-CoA-carboxylase] ligase [Hyphomicrobiales bacterium]
MRLDPIAEAAGVRLREHDTLDSTNAEALRLARAGERGPLWVVARRQTAGRGRRGRAWISEAGNLYASLLLSAPAARERWPQLSFVAAVAIHDAIATAATTLASRLAIKWPNDLLLAGAKVAGILIESEGGEAVTIGIGINCAHHPPATEQPATDLAAHGTVVSPERMLAVLADEMVSRLSQWRQGEDFGALRMEWLARAAGVGGEVRVRLADRELNGRFEALDAAGGLVLRLPSGEVITVAAGDVFLPARVCAERGG